MIMGLPTVHEWETINVERRPYLDIFTDWALWSFDINPRALDIGTLRSRVRGTILDKLTRFADDPRNADQVITSGLRMASDAKWLIEFAFNTARADLWKRRTGTVPSYGLSDREGVITMPVPTDRPIQGLVESAKLVFPERLWRETPYDIRRFALQQAEAIARLEVETWQSEIYEGYQWNPAWRQNHVFPRPHIWYDSMDRVALELAKWLSYDLTAWYYGTSQDQKKAVDEALYQQQFSPQVRAAEEQRYIPQPTSFEAPVLPRISSDAERGGFDIERVKRYAPFIGIGLGLFRILKG
jgi:hypothetical protein